MAFCNIAVWSAQSLILFSSELKTYLSQVAHPVSTAVLLRPVITVIIAMTVYGVLLSTASTSTQS